MKKFWKSQKENDKILENKIIGLVIKIMSDRIHDEVQKQVVNYQLPWQSVETIATRVAQDNESLKIIVKHIKEMQLNA